jgi:hypothetical protein
MRKSAHIELCMNICHVYNKKKLSMSNATENSETSVKFTKTTRKKQKKQTR